MSDYQRALRCERKRVARCRRCKSSRKDCHIPSEDYVSNFMNFLTIKIVLDVFSEFIVGLRQSWYRTVGLVTVWRRRRHDVFPALWLITWVVVLTWIIYKTYVYIKQPELTYTKNIQNPTPSTHTLLFHTFHGSIHFFYTTIKLFYPRYEFFS